MEAEIGTFGLILALVTAGAVAMAGLLGAARRNVNLMALAGTGSIVLFLLVALSFGCLTAGFVTSDLSVYAVAANSNTAMPLLYRVTAVWGNHEGSLLLWVLILATFGALIALAGGQLPPTLKSRVLALQAMLGVGFLALILFTSNPFGRLDPAPTEGQELNPLLQDIGLAIHPPFLYLGYVGFSVAFAFAVAALIEGRVDASWARFVRPWILAAWCCLTMGITLGSFWAYYELGWGGFWFWDPVENASFMPWLVGTALLHSALVVERRGALVIWTLLLAILTFSLSMIGTFLVRSGVLTSVHSFSADPARGIGVLLLLGLSTGGALTLFAMRAQNLSRSVIFAPVSREGGLVLNNVLLVTAVGTVFLGTFYPLFAELVSGEQISVGPPYFNRTFVPLMVPLLLAVVLGMNLRWKRDSLRSALGRGAWAVIPVLAVVAGAVILSGTGKALGAVGLGVGAWLVVGSIAWFLGRVNLFKVPFARSVAMAAGLPRALYGMLFAHIGLGLGVIGVIAVSVWQEESIRALHPGDVIEIGGFDVRLDRVRGIAGPNYDADRAVFVISRDGRDLGEMQSERRFYTASGRQTTEAAIRPRFLSNLYIAIGEPDAAGAWSVRAYFHPLALLIWIGPFLMAFGGVLSLSDRRFRLGAPSRDRSKVSTLAIGQET